MSIVEEISLDISPLGQNPRKIFIYLPNSYYYSDKRYPVLYMFDGQNIFFDEHATYGKSWGMKDFMDNYDKEIIIVGVDCNHSGNSRLIEYTPFPFDDDYYGYIDSLGQEMANWMVNTLKPYIDHNYRTLSDRDNTAVGGSSMGGLMSLYCVIEYNNVFSKAACLSFSILFIYEEMYNLLLHSNLNKNTKVYMDFGSKEIGGKKKTVKAMKSLFELNHLFVSKGVNSYPNLIENGEHNEATWEYVVPIFMDYFYN